MSKSYQKIYYIAGKVFKETTNKKAFNFAKKYAKDNGLDESNVYELSNDSELAYLKELLERQQNGEVAHICSNQKVELVKAYQNFNGDMIPPLEIDVSFIFSKIEGNGFKKQYVKVVGSVYELDKQFINEKILFDCLYVNSNYLKVVYLENEEWKEWHISDVFVFVKEAKERHKKQLAQKRAIRDRQKYDRLLRLRHEGKITERQSQELYRLEKIFGG